MAILIGFDKFEKEKAELIKRINETDLDVKSVVEVKVSLDKLTDIVLGKNGILIEVLSKIDRFMDHAIPISYHLEQTEIKKYLLQKINEAEYMDDLNKISNILSEIKFMISKAERDLL